MHLTFSSSSLGIDQAYVQDKLASLGKYIDLSAPDVRLAVQLAKSHGNDKHADDLFRAEIRVAAGGKDYYVTADHSDMHAALDLAKDEMEQVLRRAKDKRVSLARRGGKFMNKMLRRFGK